MKVESIGDAKITRDFLCQLEEIGSDVHRMQLADIVVLEQRGEEGCAAARTPIIGLPLATGFDNGAAAVLQIPAQCAFPSPETLLRFEGECFFQPAAERGGLRVGNIGFWLAGR